MPKIKMDQDEARTTANKLIALQNETVSMAVVVANSASKKRMGKAYRAMQAANKAIMKARFAFEDVCCNEWGAGDGMAIANPRPEFVVTYKEREPGDR